MLRDRVTKVVCLTWTPFMTGIKSKLAGPASPPARAGWIIIWGLLEDKLPRLGHASTAPHMHVL